MKRYALALVLATLLAAPLLADIIDEAEAKRRGVPLSQVLAEKALAQQKVKNAALEKQLADLQKQLNPNGPATPPPATPNTAATPTRTPPAPLADSHGSSAHPMPSSKPSGAPAPPPAVTAPASPFTALTRITLPDDGQAHAIKINRPPISGTYVTHFYVERAYTAITTPRNGQPSIENFSFKVTAAGKLTTYTVTTGQAMDVNFGIEKSEANGNPLFDPNMIVWFEHHNDHWDYHPPGGRPDLNSDQNLALRLMIPPPDLTMTPNDDDTFGNAGPHKLNEEWAIDPNLTARQLQRDLPYLLDPANIKGTAKFVAIETVNGIKAYRVKVEIDATNVKPDRLVESFSVESGKMHVAIERVVPADARGRHIESSFVAESTIVQTSPVMGRFQATMRTVRKEVAPPPTPRPPATRPTTQPTR